MVTSFVLACVAAAAPTVTAPSSTPLAVSAGLDQVVQRSTVVDLDGRILNNTLPVDQLTIQWSVVSGPGDVHIVDAAAIDTQATFSADGDYVLRFEVVEGGTTESDTVAVQVVPPFGVVIQLDHMDRGQLISGWEATANVELASAPGFLRFRNRLFNRAAHELGINRVRLEVRSGAESPVDWYQMYRRGLIDYGTWREKRYETVNDDDDPNTINWSGYQFTELDETVEQLVLPLKQRLNNRGKRLFVNLCYVSFTEQTAPGSTFIHTDAEEYAEFAQATMKHLEMKYDIVPDSWEISLEPDNVPEWNGTNMGEALVATGGRLAAEGYFPKFVGPSTTNMANTTVYFDDMILVPGALTYLRELSYHRYGGVSEAVLTEIANRAEQHNLETSHLELISASYETLHEDIKIGKNSAWSQYALGTRVPNPDNGSAYFIIDDTNPAAPTVEMGAQTKFMRQYFYYITPGSQRIGASTTTTEFDPLAFLNEEGKTILIVKAQHVGSFKIEGLPAGTYGLNYTTVEESDVELAPVTLIEGQRLDLSLPKRGVMSIYPL